MAYPVIPGTSDPNGPSASLIDALGRSGVQMATITALAGVAVWAVPASPRRTRLIFSVPPGTGHVSLMPDGLQASAGLVLTDTTGTIDLDCLRYGDLVRYQWAAVSPNPLTLWVASVAR